MKQADIAVGHPATSRHRARRLRWGSVLVVGALIFCSIIFIGPLVWLFLTALKTYGELGALPVHIIPRQAQWGNFQTALTMIDFFGFARNSLILSGMNAALLTSTSALVGFGFARLRGTGKGPLFLVMLATTMLPPILTIIPTYIIFSRIGMVYNYWPWVVWGLGSNPLLSFLYRQFFASIPLELEDAAIIDGCGYLRMFVQMFLPLSRPVIATAAIFSFQWVWGDWFAPNIFLTSDNTTLAVAMSQGYVNPQGFILTNVMSAGALLYIVPVLVLFFFAQRYFVQGIVTTGLKG